MFITRSRGENNARRGQFELSAALAPPCLAPGANRIFDRVLIFDDAGSAAARMHPHVGRIADRACGLSQRRDRVQIRVKLKSN